MGNGCSSYQANKICLCSDLNIISGKDNLENKKDNQNNKVKQKKIIKINSSINRQKSISSNGIKFKSEHNNNKQDQEQEQNASNNSSHKNEIQNNENPKDDNINNKNPRFNFTNYVQDLDVSFNNNKEGKELKEQNDIFDNNYIKIKNEYNEEIIDYLNKIRNQPNNIIIDIDDLLNKSQKIVDSRIQIESDITHENIILEDGEDSLLETKKYLNSSVPVRLKFNLNEDLSIDIPESEKTSDIPLEKKISKILMNKRRNIINNYPKCQFFVNFIKDIKIGLIFLLSQNETLLNFRNVLFDEQYKEFNVTWMKDKKKFFIAFLCFA